ncbi:hypothetical protein HOU70_gp43 [Arthrobacter phage Liebe]|uniref:Uncharacterized protein n=2 Tax=Arthrobacter virus Liebe TaxID=2734245 RepID=A0A3G2KHS7_9CAUD|nr:hypothetical protein HOU70_gp43 [Arthrobacter phage Liebe]AYN58524.1 hypothetical protein PBI_MAUREEN_43 [Arthrobacter phage Maureen]AZF93776.1 hypothetical protein PBI_LIEBE_43 [Arthrobacter phage Liebe]
MTRRSMGRRPVVTWEEQDVYTSWRRVLAYVQRPGVVRAVKRRTHKRERREARADIRTTQREGL